jgi:hypothetical protein
MATQIFLWSDTRYASLVTKAAKFANHTNDSSWEILAQRRKIARICSPFKTYTGEQVWWSMGDRLQGPCYHSRDDQGSKIRTSKQRRAIGKYSFVNRTIKLRNQLPAEALATFPCKWHTYRKSVRKVIREKWRVFEGWWRYVQKWTQVKHGERGVVKRRDEKKSVENWWSLVKCVYYHWFIVT